MKPGPFQVDARVVVQHRNQADLEVSGLRLALLAGSPPPEGGKARHIAGPGYVAADLVLARSARGARTLLNTEAIRFSEALDWTQASHVGVVNDDDDVLAYGPLKSSPGAANGYDVSFAVGAVRVRFW